MIDFLTLLVIGAVAYAIIKAAKKSPKESASNLVSNKEQTQPENKKATLVDSINKLREERKEQEGQKLTVLENDVASKRSTINSYNSEADEMGLRKSLCYIIDETKHWHAWKDNTEDFVKKYTDIDDFTFQDAREKKVKDRNLFELDFIFNKKEFQIAYQVTGSFEGTTFGLIEVFEQNNEKLEKMLSMSTHMEYDDYSEEHYDAGDISLYKIGEWIPMVVSVEAGLEAISRRGSLELDKRFLDEKFTE